MTEDISFTVVSGKTDKKSFDDPCVRICYMIYQIIIWGLIAGIIIASRVRYEEKNKDEFTIKLFLGILLFLFAIFYIVGNFESPEWRCLNNVKSPTQIKNLMPSLFSNPLKINLKAKSSHSSRKRGTVTSKEEEIEFKYYSGRDISGVFSIDADKVSGCCLKSMLKLKLKIDYEFADEVSKLDYIKEKDALIERNKRDVYLGVTEEKLIEGFEEYFLVSFSDRESLSINKVLYFIFVIIIPVIELYKIYLNICWADQTFTIKRVISTRYDLNENQFVKKYSINNPKLSFGGNEQTFENIHHTKSERLYESPSQDEINQATIVSKNFVKKLSSYKIKYKSDIVNQNQMGAPYYHMNPDFKQGELQMQGYPNLDDSFCVNTPSNLYHTNVEVKQNATDLDSSSGVELKRKFFE